jgi:formylglycine-generating enzyme required for sulfatase activity
MGRSESSGTDYYPGGSIVETPEHLATIAPFALDRYEVTVSRFRQFVNSYDVWRSSHPVVGEGAHPSAPNTGWGQSWTPAVTDLPANGSDLKALIACDPAYQTWSSSVGTDLSETYPINCINWYVAFAFCIWDGGRLPTEAEWEYTAAGGSENRLYPWGKDTPIAELANFGSFGASKTVVGSKLITGGEGYFGHADLAGSTYEWTFDWFSAGMYGTTGSLKTCDNCANSTQASPLVRVTRGGGWSYVGSELRSAKRDGFLPLQIDDLFGIRCARSVK